MGSAELWRYPPMYITLYLRLEDNSVYGDSAASPWGARGVSPRFFLSQRLVGSADLLRYPETLS